MKRYAVIGNPIAHSRSPEIHAAFAAQFDLELRYQRLLAPLDSFSATASAFLQSGGEGFNVTVPFKGAAADWVERLEASAAAAGAVNTVALEGGATVGHNTDGLGLLADLTQNLAMPVTGARVLVLGAGGAAAGVLGPLLAAGPSELTLANRTRATAERLAERFPGIRVVPFNALQESYDLVINATSIGLGDAKKNHFHEGFEQQIPAITVRDALTYDMLYGAAAGFSQYALSHGAQRSADGLGMLVEQAAAAFTLWHGQQPDTAPVIAALARPQTGMDT